MSLFVIGDLHLSLSCDKPMDIFSGWEGYVDKLCENWQSKVSPEDTVVVPGDISWVTRLDDAQADFRFIHELNGRKIILKGNHDYWWTTMTKMNKFLQENGFDSISILNNNHFKYENFGICGTRGWINDNTAPADAKVLAREAMRLEASISSAENAGLTPLVFLHYPPVFAGDCNYDILDVLFRHNITECYYGHIHGRSCEYAVQGERDGINYHLISSDYLKFDPYFII